MKKALYLFASATAMFTAAAVTVASAGEKSAAVAAEDLGPLISYHNPETMPRWGYSYAASFEGWLEAVELERIYPSDRSGDVKAQAKSAFAQLNKRLAELGSSDLYIVRVDMTFKGASYDNTLKMSAALEEFFDHRLSHAPAGQSFVDYPVSSIFGTDQLGDEDVLVALDVTLANVHEHKYADVLVPERRLSLVNEAGGKRNVLIGNVTAMQDNFLIKGYGDTDAEATAAMENFERVVKAAGGTLEDVRTVKVHYVPDDVFRAANNSATFRVVSTASNVGYSGKDLTVKRDERKEAQLRGAIQDFMKSKLGDAYSEDAIQIEMEVVAYTCVEELSVAVSGSAIVG